MRPRNSRERAPRWVHGTIGFAFLVALSPAYAAKDVDAVSALRVATAHVNAKGLPFAPERCTITIEKRRNWVVEFRLRPIGGHQLLGSHYQVHVDERGKITQTARR